MPAIRQNSKRTEEKPMSDKTIATWKPVAAEKCEHEGPYECPHCGFHLQLDATYIEQVIGTSILCPNCASLLSVPDDDLSEAMEGIKELHDVKALLNAMNAIRGQLALVFEQIPTDVYLARCDNCGAVYDEEDLEVVKDLNMRVDTGGEVPAGQCPDCGALAYRLKRWN
jgi:transcription elongation factor Elf1